MKNSEVTLADIATKNDLADVAEVLTKRIDDKSDRLEVLLKEVIKEVRLGFKAISEKRLSKIEKDIESLKRSKAH